MGFRSIDYKTAQYISLVVDPNQQKLAHDRFKNKNEDAGEELMRLNRAYLDKIHTADAYLSYGPQADKIAKSFCNAQKIIMKCAVAAHQKLAQR